MLYFLILYANLDNPHYTVRESATEQLTKLVADHPGIYGPRCLELIQTCTEPEIKARLRQPLVKYGSWKASNFIPKSCPVWPTCDAYVESIQGVDVRIGHRLNAWRNPIKCNHLGQATPEENGPYYFSYRDATRRYIQYEIGSHHMTSTEADALLSRMWAMEKKTFPFSTPKEWDSLKWNDGFPPITSSFYPYH